MNHTYVLLEEYFLKCFLESLQKKNSNIFLKIILLCQGLCKRFQNICNFQNFGSLFLSPFNVKNMHYNV
jgi:hypothetical protein